MPTTASTAALGPASTGRAYRRLYGTILLECVEKRKPHYSLASIKAIFATEASLRMTVTARNTAFGLGILQSGVVTIIQGMTREQFYKSMTSLADTRIWQDVYHVPVESTSST